MVRSITYIFLKDEQSLDRVTRWARNTITSIYNKRQVGTLVVTYLGTVRYLLQWKSKYKTDLTLRLGQALSRSLLSLKGDEKVIKNRISGTGYLPMVSLVSRVADPDPNPDLFGWIRIIFTRFGSVSGSGSYRYFGNVKLNKQGKNILKIEFFTHFQLNFSIFSDKNNHHSNIRRNMFDVKKF